MPIKSLRTNTDFPATRPSKEQMAEDAFMEELGSSGPRALYRMVEAIGSVGPALGQLLSRAASLASQLRPQLSFKRHKST